MRSLLPHEGQVGLQLDLVRDLEDEDLGQRDAVIGKGRGELGAHLDVVAGEAEALLILDLLGCEFDPGDRRFGDTLDGLLLDGQHAPHLGRDRLPTSSGPLISTPFISKVTQRLASTSVSRKFLLRMSASRLSMPVRTRFMSILTDPVAVCGFAGSTVRVPATPSAAVLPTKVSSGASLLNVARE